MRTPVLSNFARSAFSVEALRLDLKEPEVAIPDVLAVAPPTYRLFPVSEITLQA
jgi:hypothetical protein